MHLRRPILTILAAVLLLVVALPALATTVGPVTELVAGPTTASQRKPVASWDGTRYVVVWEDGRSTGSGAELYLTRVMPDGTIVDTDGIPLLSPPQPGSQSTPSIAWHPTGQLHVLTWIDPRDGSPDVFAARFNPMGVGTPLEPGGIRLTANSSAERAPNIACNVASCLIAFQTIVDGGGGRSILQGQRILHTGDLIDANPINLVPTATTVQEPDVLATNSGFIVGWEDARNLNTGILGSDIFARVVHATDPLMPDAGTTLHTADRRQSAVELVPAAGGNFLAVWQDQRALTGTISDDNIWRQQFTPALAATGPAPGPLNTVIRDQSFPAAAGDDDGALVVWGDRRGGGFTLVYGATLDASGAPKEPEGFPVLIFNSAVSDQAVTKGPDSDYLVMAVRLLPRPSRAFFRIVRDEPPGMALTHGPSPQVPADGVAVARVDFDDAKGASGFDVVNGTMYTVTFSRAVDVTVPDQAPGIAGHQVTAFDGSVSFGLFTLDPGTVTVDLASVDGMSTGTVDVIFDNVPPVVSNVRIEPQSPKSSEDLVLLYDYFDVNSHPEGMSEVQWTRNSAIQPNLNNLTTVDARFINRGEVWRARLRPHDGTGFGTFVFSDEVLVLNTEPRALDVRIVPDMDVKTGTALTARYRFDDPDSDAEMGTVLTWYESGAVQLGLANATTVPGATVAKGQSWSFGVTPHDGTTAGPTVRSATVTVENSVPVAEAGPQGEVVERRTHVMDGTGSSDVDPQDNLSFTWRQIAGEPTVTLSSVSSATVSFVAPSVQGTTMLTFGLVVSDGEADSPEDRVVVLITPVPDTDADGLDDEEEADLGTDPMRGDTDRDSMQDGPEVAIGLDPLDGDTDDDGIRDGEEPMPGEDTDMDGDVNGADWDSDNDGISDGTEIGVTEATPDTDEAAGHFIPDADRTTMTNPLVADTDMDQLDDGVEDANHNGKIDRGESAPNDPTSTVGCDANGGCPGNLECIRDACREPPMADGGVMCRPLAEMGVQCCMGGCAQGTVIAPLCMAQGAREMCPVGADQCILTACQGPTTPTPGDDGCSCSASQPAGGTVAWMLVPMLLIGLRRRRD